MIQMEKLNLKQMIEDLGFTCVAGENLLNRKPESAYVSDLLSDVMGKAKADMVWVTSQTHKNIIAVASLKDLAAIIVVNERVVAQDVIDQANEEEVVIISSGLAAFETVGLLYDYLNA